MFFRMMIIASALAFSVACQDSENASFTTDVTSQQTQIEKPIQPGIVNIGATITNTPDVVFCSKKAVTSGWGSAAQELADCGKVEASLQYVLCYDDKKVDLECLPYRSGMSVKKLSAYDSNKEIFDDIQTSIAATLNVADHNGCLSLASNANAKAPGFLCIRLAKQ